MSVERKEGKVGSELSEQVAKKKKNTEVPAVGTNLCTGIRRTACEAVIWEVLVPTKHFL